ncbi:sensor histidine kinase [Flavilitoribacter nigricans]|uniref:histidine kinase n=1 Tax=Flavilitoribacter nigricans (strain ATCC 23147 / DSM 23189 / NBRC 102662 / NCIMB 1420 / SS-2) TaxID=1122177 RepID=A0A2D0N5X0_FLAN2|nr:sensor histidine kinase [Flavilitoribacter nigricans]PHN03790.1 hypothetical protein CRP01_24900 [Flavilitoribacter nigricans DSM 23189 = NBRC 102662]
MLHPLPATFLKILLLVTTIGALPGVAQERYDVEHWGIDKGLANREVHFAARDPKGLLWVVSSNLQLYDGHKFTLFSRSDPEHYLPLVDIHGALQYSDSILLLVNAQELYAFNTNTYQSEPWDWPEGMNGEGTLNGLLLQEGHQPDFAIVQKDRNGQSLHLISKDWRRLLSVNLPELTQIKNSRLGIGPSATLWLSDPLHNRILKFTEAERDTIPFDYRGFDRWVDSYLIYHPTYGLLVLMANGLVHRYDEDAGSWELLMDSPREREAIHGVNLEHSGKLRVTGSQQLFLIDLEKKETTTIDQALLSGTPRIDINYTFEDREKNTWYCTHNGLYKVNENTNPFQTALQNEAPGNNRQFREIFPLPDGRSIGARFFERVTDIHLGVIERDGRTLNSPEPLSAVKPGGRYVPVEDWIWTIDRGTDKLVGRNLITGRTRVTHLTKAANNSYFNQFCIQDQQLHYVDEQNDISVFDLVDSSFHTVHLAQKELFRRSGDRFLVLDHGRYIQGWNKAGLTVHDARSGELLHHISTRTYPQLSSDFMNCLLMNGPDSLWVGTLGGGLLFIDLKRDKVRSYTTAEGLSNNQVASLIEDDLGNLWIGTYYGLNRLDRETGELSNYFEKDGLPNNEFNYLSTYKDEAGILYLGTLNGFMKFDPARLLVQDTLPPVLLTSIQRYNRQQDRLIVQDRLLDQTRQVVLSPYDNYLEFAFAVPSFVQTGDYSYSVKLEGLDKDWQDLGKNHTIRYRKLPAGKFTFLVKARDANGVESPVSRALEVRVNDFFYNYWWFKLLAILTLATVFTAFYKYRIRLLQKEADTRIRIAQDLHDEIGSSMTRMSMLMQLLEAKISTEQKPLLFKLEALMDQSITQLRDLVWAVDRSSDRWKDVLTRMEHYAYDTLRPREILFDLEATAIDPDKLLRPNEKRNIYLIFKEAINNIAKHSDAMRVRARLENKGNYFTMSIVDDGHPPEVVKKGHGLDNLRRRAERLGGTLTHGFGDPGGFKVTLRVPGKL